MMVMGLGNAFAEDTWVKTDPADLKTGDVVMIIDLDSKRAMSNNKGTSSAPVATRVYFNNDETVSTGISNNTVPATLQWEVTVDNDSYKFGVSGTSNYLYCTNKEQREKLLETHWYLSVFRSVYWSRLALLYYYNK